jgi:hypothetical protein
VGLCHGSKRCERYTRAEGKKEMDCSDLLKSGIPILAETTWKNVARVKTAIMLCWSQNKDDL